MITELVRMRITSNGARDFVKMYEDTAPVIRRQKGYISDKLMRSIEDPEEFVLTVEWVSVEAHEALIASDDYSLLDMAFKTYLVEAHTSHYVTVS
jgi:heme-degrading monooxygenase HmoA